MIKITKWRHFFQVLCKQSFKQRPNNWIPYLGGDSRQQLWGHRMKQTRKVSPYKCVLLRSLLPIPLESPRNIETKKEEEKTRGWSISPWASIHPWFRVTFSTPMERLHTRTEWVPLVSKKACYYREAHWGEPKPKTQRHMTYAWGEILLAGINDVHSLLVQMNLEKDRGVWCWEPKISTTLT